MPTHRAVSPFTDYAQVLRRERQYRFMIAANAVSRFGDSIDVVAYSWLIYEVTGSASWLAVLVGVNMLPTVLLQPFMGALSSFLDKKKVIAWCDVARGALVCATGVCMLLGVLNIGLLIGFTLLNSCFEALRVPCGIALLPSLLQKESYKTALSLNQGVSRAMELLGLGASGMVIAALGTGGALLVDAATFFLSAALLFCMRLRADAPVTTQTHGARASGQAFDAENATTPRHNAMGACAQVHTDNSAPSGHGAPAKPQTPQKQPSPPALPGYFAHLREGLRYFKKSRLAVLLCFLCAVLNVALIPLENLNVAFVQETLQLGLLTVSAGSVCLTLGTILGALFYPALSRGVRVQSFLCGGGLVIGALYGAFVCAGFLPLDTVRTVGYAALCLLFGFVNSMLGMAVQIYFMTLLPQDMLGRIGGLFNAVVCASVPLASFAISGVVRFASMRTLFLGMGALTLVVFAAVWLRTRDVFEAA